MIPGDEISENYGLMYTAKDFGDRQSILKNHYKFDCSCMACIEGWPTMLGMSNEMMLDQGDIKMTRFFKIRCIKCKEIIRRKGYRAFKNHPFQDETFINEIVCYLRFKSVFELIRDHLSCLRRRDLSQ